MGFNGDACFAWSTCCAEDRASSARVAPKKPVADAHCRNFRRDPCQDVKDGTSSGAARPYATPKRVTSNWSQDRWRDRERPRRDFVGSDE